MNTLIVTAWHREEELHAFCKAWDVRPDDERIVFQHDARLEGCGATKNKGVIEAVKRGADIVIVLDGDCYPSSEAPAITHLMAAHEAALQHQPVPMFETVTTPASRGTPYLRESLRSTMPVAASMGFWYGVPDYCAVRQLAFKSEPMAFKREPVFGRYFPLCGMNVAFRPRDWWPWCQFIEVSRYDDIWQGWLWQKEAYRRGCCFNLNGPIVTHSRQSNVWRNLTDEALYAKETETLWRDIATHPSNDYGELLKLLPAGTERLSSEAFDRRRP